MNELQRITAQRDTLWAIARDALVERLHGASTREVDAFFATLPVRSPSGHHLDKPPRDREPITHVVGHLREAVSKELMGG